MPLFGESYGHFFREYVAFGFVLAGWLLCSGVLGQVWVTGRVLSEDGFPVEGANVQVLDENRGTVTDSVGQFGVEMNVPGRLRITHLNYYALEVLVKKGEFLLVALKPLEHRLGERNEGSGHGLDIPPGFGTDAGFAGGTGRGEVFGFVAGCGDNECVGCGTLCAWRE